MYHIGDAAISQITRDREALEVRLAKRLEEELWRYVTPLRTYVKTAIDWILGLNEVFLTRILITKTPLLTLWLDFGCRPSAMNLRDRVMPKVDQWTLSHCSDLIRLWGEVVEEAPKAGIGLGGVAAGKEAQRSNVAFQAPYRGRQNRPGGPAPVPAHLQPLVRFAQTSSVKRPGASRGITVSVLTPRDTVKKIDTMYGLPEGMSISGTTTDSIFFLDHAISHAGALGLDPALLGALHLLPLATMVSRYHHTLFECALALTLPPAHKLDYMIGFYTSLMPSDLCSPMFAGTERSVGADALLSIMSEFEHEARDMHLFAWTLRNRRQGVLFDVSELHQCEKIFEVTQQNMTSWRVMSHTSTCAQAVNLWRRCVPTIPLPAPLVQDARSFGYSI